MFWLHTVIFWLKIVKPVITVILTNCQLLSVQMKLLTAEWGKTDILVMSELILTNENTFSVEQESKLCKNQDKYVVFKQVTCSLVCRLMHSAGYSHWNLKKIWWLLFHVTWSLEQWISEGCSNAPLTVYLSSVPLHVIDAIHTQIYISSLLELDSWWWWYIILAADLERCRHKQVTGWSQLICLQSFENSACMKATVHVEN